MNLGEEICPTLSISALERETGLSKDTLRVWERRYGFPRPLRDSNGDRVYPMVQVEQLRLACRLLDRGLRPSKVLPLPVDQLGKLAQSLGDKSQRDLQVAGDLQYFMQQIKHHDALELRHALSKQLRRQGLERFVYDVIAPLNVMVGEAWAWGELRIFEEHLYTEVVQSILREAISRELPMGKPPRILLATLPKEHHSLGLLMVEAVLTVEGAQCVSMGMQMPISEIISAAEAYGADIVGLSFSAAYPAQHVDEDLQNVRARLPGTVELWAGGTGIARVKQRNNEIRCATSLPELVKYLQNWRGRA